MPNIVLNIILKQNKTSAITSHCSNITKTLPRYPSTIINVLIKEGVTFALGVKGGGSEDTVFYFGA
eukprot:13743792-Ditylum_brightwellii.AAC.1